MTTATEAAGTTPSEVDIGQLRAIVDDLAERLDDPQQVAATASAPENVDQHPGMPRARPPWGTLGLGETHAGVALLYAELSHRDARYRSIAHAHLAAAAQGLGQPPGPGLFGGTASLAFAAFMARHDEDDYAGLLETLDAQVTNQLRTLLSQEEERLAARQAGVHMHSYDVISGAVGLGRYLLLRGQRHRHQLSDTLAYLVRLTEPVQAHGHTVPGWWAPTKPGIGPQYPRGHFNLGLAHGISGPLALLSLAWQQDVRVPGQQNAITVIVDHLTGQQTEQGLWPGAIGFDTLIDGQARHTDQAPMTAWCYGTPGTARAIQLAGVALERADWQTLATDAMAAALGQSLENALTDSSLCHGWAGILHTADLMARDSSDPRIAGQLPRLANALQAAHCPDLSFGYSYERPYFGPGIRNAPHRAGFLEGSAGIALALNAYLNNGPTCPWNTALLVA
ncbi:lanthionine synthetase C family protein [Streptomyces violascens]|uniref:Lanthionine synthetase n=1 Tax=Streptomyces violascens TaxID=67381 RepID=A0ABQ3QRQ3_9ACTN|nr:lanthionine synthetase C family protein [Streptomyces violascens]GHI39957.1 hypothetical protein Sviol_43650 [Streptomyces violascens]